jgi:hypothetical protein
MSGEIKKVIIAVHGIGNQTQFATAQQVLSQFSHYYGGSAAVPLGNFHVEDDSGVLTLEEPKTMSPFAFAEVYWAHIPRELVEQKYVLEDVQPWVRTIIGRIRQRQLAAKGELKDSDERMIEQVLSEMLETIDVLERLCFLADKMGIFSFDLKKVLVDFVDDVQVVADFKQQGGQIGQEFAKRMQTVNERFKDAEEIYIIAHSEGTVVTLLGLLTALCTRNNSWISKVRGLMTIGSPIDKHLILWPELFEAFQTPCHQLSRPIEWHNYYDYGDPVGFELDTARKKYTSGAWEGVFNFPERNDHGFGRSPLPGKAHTDYWKDDQVFGHFIDNVIEKDSKAQPPSPQESGKPAPAKFPESPPDKWWAQFVSRTLPYTIGAALLFCAVFVLYKAVHGLLHPDTPLTLWPVFGEVAGLSCLLAGVTVMARVPRLTQRRKLHWIGGLIFLVSIFGFQALSCLPGNGEKFGTCMTTAVRLPGSDLSFVGLALALVFAVYLVGRLRPAYGLSALLSLGGAVVAYVVFRFVDGSEGNLWPVFLAGAVFLYLWWLVALLFDLTFVWHRYIRDSWKNPILRKWPQEQGAAPQSGARRLEERLAS